MTHLSFPMKPCSGTYSSKGTWYEMVLTKKTFTHAGCRGNNFHAHD